MREILSWLDLSQEVSEIFARLRKETKGMVEPMSFSIVSLFGRDPFLVLISCVLSARTRDSVTLPASLRLFSLVTTPQDLIKLSLLQIEKSIYPVLYYREKARNIQILCAQLLEKHEGKVPSTFNELILLRGVGPKTANLVLGVGFGIPAICVDTHVHKICNRLGLVKTTTPIQTEAALKEIVPKENWIELNRLLVMWGQNICVPLSPYCSRCVLYDLCPKQGITSSR